MSSAPSAAPPPRPQAPPVVPRRRRRRKGRPAGPRRPSLEQAAVPKSFNVDAALSAVDDSARALADPEGQARLRPVQHAAKSRSQIESGKIRGEHIIVDTENGERQQVQDHPQLRAARARRRGAPRRGSARARRGSQRAPQAARRCVTMLALVGVVLVAGGGGAFWYAKKHAESRPKVVKEVVHDDAYDFMKGVEISMKVDPPAAKKRSGAAPCAEERQAGEFSDVTNLGDASEDGGDETLDQAVVQRVMTQNFRCWSAASREERRRNPALHASTWTSSSRARAGLGRQGQRPDRLAARRLHVRQDAVGRLPQVQRRQDPRLLLARAEVTHAHSRSPARPGAVARLRVERPVRGIMLPLTTFDLLAPRAVDAAGHAAFTVRLPETGVWRDTLVGTALEHRRLVVARGETVDAATSRSSTPTRSAGAPPSPGLLLGLGIAYFMLGDAVHVVPAQLRLSRASAAHAARAAGRLVAAAAPYKAFLLLTPYPRLLAARSARSRSPWRCTTTGRWPSPARWRWRSSSARSIPFDLGLAIVLLIQGFGCGASFLRSRASRGASCWPASAAALLAAVGYLAL